jgi:hypothetical protein
MEELKLLIGMVADLPQMALWVLIGFLIYKLAVIGSIYGTIRFIVDKLHSWLTNRDQEMRPLLDGIVITGNVNGLMAQLHRCKHASGKYIHQTDVEWLREAIDAKLEAEKAHKESSAAS